MSSDNHAQESIVSIESMIKTWSDTLLFCINGTEVKMNLIDPETTLLEYLRGIGLTGTKLGCGEGVCGSCTVVINERYEIDDKLRGISPRHLSVVACKTPLAYMDGKHIITTEKLGNTSKPHAIQERIAYMHGSQCGFCSPGMVMSLYALLGNRKEGGSSTPHDIEEAFDGNLCRCTGYRPILNAAHSVNEPEQPVNAYSGGFSCGEGECCMWEEKGAPPGQCCKIISNLSNDDGSSGEDAPPVKPRDITTTPMKKFTPPNYTQRIAHTKLLFSKVPRKYEFKPLAFGLRCIRPNTLSDVLSLRARFPKDTKLVAGATSPVKMNDGRCSILIGGLPDLREYSWEEEYLSIGACLTLTEVDGVLREAIKHYGPLKSQSFEAIRKYLKLVASPQIRNMATIAGNLLLASPVSDIGIFLIASRSRLSYRTHKSKDTHKGEDAPLYIDMKDIFVGCGKTKLPEEGVVIALHIPCSGKNEFIRMYKQSKRKIFDLPIVNAGLWISLGDSGIVKSANLVYGGISSRVFQATGTMTYLEGKQWSDNQVLEFAMDELAKDFDSNLGPDLKLKIETKIYKKSLMLGFFYRFWHETVRTKEGDIGEIERKISTGNYPYSKDLPHLAALKHATGVTRYTDDIPPQYNEVHGHLVLSKKPHADIEVDWSPAMKTPGVIEYVDYRDLPEFESVPPKDNPYNQWNSGGGESEPLFAVNEVLTAGQVIGMVIAETRKQAEAGAAVVCVKYKEKPAILTIEDAICKNSFFESKLKITWPSLAKTIEDAGKDLEEAGKNIEDARKIMEESGKNIEEAGKSIEEVGKRVGEAGGSMGKVGMGIGEAGKDIEGLRKDIEELGKVIEEGGRDFGEVGESIKEAGNTIEEGGKGIKEEAKSIEEPENSIEEALEESGRRISGKTRIGGQEHFYLETNAALVVPKFQDGELEVFSSTQNPTEVQAYIAQFTGVPENRIVVRVKCLGGGFGGKDTRSIPLAGICAIAAKKLNRPVRCMLSRKDDMISSGQRHAFYAEWEVGVTDSGDEMGKITALKAQIYALTGWSMDNSGSICYRALSHIDNCYKIPNVSVKGSLCRTNTVSNTAFRGFGAPEGMFIAESFIEEIADHLGIPSDKIREINMYKKGEETHFRQVLEDWHVPRLVTKLKKETNYSVRCEEVEKFNKENKFKKRGLSLIPTKFGVSFTKKTQNQAGALVHIYQDGSVLVAHGGVEMGQGLFTKMSMIVAKELDVSIDSVFCSETATNTVANTSATSSSTASDLNGYAVYNACKVLKGRLEKYRAGGIPLKEAVKKAYKDRVNLSANGFYKPNIGARLFSYFTQGVCLSEVEIDTITGDWTCISADIMMDIGKSLNPAIDWGQITGAFVQGQGLFTTEEVTWGADGNLDIGPDNYKIPGARDIPQVFNVNILAGGARRWANLRNIHTSKGVGEPPLFLAASVFFAIRDALKSARADNGVRGVLSLESPATPERIRLACGDDQILKRIRGKD